MLTVKRQALSFLYSFFDKKVTISFL
ncbi:hypothetical protein KM92DES2_10598 [uncultured Desulfovibrio sp.]|uniref:T-ag OBD domain-containing protein n=1 Tax=uncultured Desulfovibrio sp. TaxID=167968 RepID=A0A212J6C8_9BACT|nr:hypothetical protein KM92DES2_10598 [uncultured Desulfovibrio sp.]